ncbi:MAG TPA: peptidase M14 [Reyranella sp.]|nr:peptidase M14 [Reyranella sp.]
MASLLDIEIPRTLDEIVRDAKAGTALEAWVFEDERSRRAAEAELAEKGVRARIRSAYKPLLHFFLEEVELTGLTAVTVRTPSHPLAAGGRFRIEAYPLSGLLRGVTLRFEKGADELHYVVVTEHGARKTEHCVFAPNRERRNVLGETSLSPCGWLQGKPLVTEYETAFDRIMGALDGHAWKKTQPFFEMLDIAVHTGGIEQRLPYGDETLSTRESMHEDLYFSILEFFKARNGLDPEDRTLQPGQIVPDIRAGAGATRISISLKPADRTTWTDEAQPLESADRPLAPAQILHEVEALGGTRFDVVSGQGRPVLATLIGGKGPGMLVSGGQHANETSGVVGALRAAKVLKEKGRGFALVPQENADGYAMHGKLRRHNPRHANHAARFSGLGDDVEFRDHEPFGERAARLEAFRRTKAVLHVNLHGYPAHEWTRPHSGYVPPRSALWAIPRGFFLIIRHHPGLRAKAENFIRKLAERVSRVPGLKEFNEAHLAAFGTHIGELPQPIHHSISLVIGETARFVPPYTVVSEYPDETIYGDAFCLAHTVQMETVLAAADLLDAGELE